MSTGRAAPSLGTPPIWMAVGFAVGASRLAWLWNGTLIRSGLLLFVVSIFMSALVPARTLLLGLVQLLLTGAMAVLIAAACWPLATRTVKAIAITALLALAPFRYWSIDNWYSVNGRSRLFSVQSLGDDQLDGRNTSGTTSR